MRYHQHLNYHKRARFVRRSIVIGCLAVLLALGVVAYYFGNYRADNNETAVSAPTSSYVAPHIQIFRSPFFQFQTNQSWSEDVNNSQEGKYVYRSLRGDLIEHQLTVYVDRAPENAAITRVLEARINENQELEAVKISAHCGEVAGDKAGKKRITMDGISFECFSDDTRYNVLVGLMGGTTNISLPRPDGSQAAYSIYYSNVTATPNATQLEEIVNSFQTR